MIECFPAILQSSGVRVGRISADNIMETVVKNIITLVS